MDKPTLPHISYPLKHPTLVRKQAPLRYDNATKYDGGDDKMLITPLTILNPDKDDYTSLIPPAIFHGKFWELINNFPDM